MVPFDTTFNYLEGAIGYPSKEECFGTDYWEMTISEFPEGRDTHGRPKLIWKNKSPRFTYYGGGIYEPRNGATGIYWIGAPTLDCPSDGKSIKSNFMNIFFYVKERADEYNDAPVYTIEGGSSDVAKELWRGTDGFWYASPSRGVADSSFGFFKSSTSLLLHLNQSAYVQLDKIYTGEEPRIPEMSAFIRVKNFRAWFPPKPITTLYIDTGGMR
ncbi:MAG: hypothetical protein DDT31_01398 [Syntrophomonadaceae bacterium]|nr:hypothetical protein [Bacillota bacterium]